MPFINIKLAGPAPAEKKAEVVKAVTKIMVDVLGKNPDTTHVVIEELSPENWGVAGETVASRRKRGL